MNALGRKYPLARELKRIKTWKYTDDPNDWMDYVILRWWMPDWGIRRVRSRLYMSTGGWSGNEEIIRAMRENFIMWDKTWHSVRRGGHYVFILPRRSKGKKK